MPRPVVRRELQYYEPNDALNGLFSKTIWLVFGAGAVRNRTYRGGRTASCDSLVRIKHLANEPLNSYI